MGIHDRDYIRDIPARGKGPGLGVASVRMWSANTWLIAICIAVFVIDGFLPASVVTTGRFEPAEITKLDIDKLELGETPRIRDTEVTLSDGTRRVEQVVCVPLIDPATKQQVGWAEVFPFKMRPIEKAMHFSTLRGFLGVQFWRFIGFQFLHSHVGLAHIVFNMIGLFFFGPMVERYLGSKRYLAFYLLCGIFGAVMYLLLNLSGFIVSLLFGPDATVPGLLFNSPATPLMGASAGVYGVLLAGAYLAPNARVLLFFVVPMRLTTLAYAIVIFSFLVVFFGGDNAGGHAGHLGGALAGFYLIRNPQRLHGFFDVIGRVDPTSHHYRNRPRRPGGGAPRAEIDRILDKISNQGLHALTEKEKRILRQESERK